jgi:hypothetical protein
MAIATSLKGTLNKEVKFWCTVPLESSYNKDIKLFFEVNLIDESLF